MPTNRRRSSESYGGSRSEYQDESLRGGYTPFERMGVEAMYRTPGAFNFSSLEEKYPTRQVVPIVPSYVRREIDEGLLEQKEQMASQRIREAQASIYESQLNEKLQTADQVILAREAFSQLNPQDPDYPNKRDKIFMDLPFAENDASFMKSVVGRNDRLYENYFKKNLAVKNLTLKDLDDSYKTIQGITESASGRDLTPEEQGLISLHKSKLSAGLKQQGVEMPQQGLVPSAGTTQNPSFKEGKIYKQGGKQYKYTNGQFVELP